MHGASDRWSLYVCYYALIYILIIKMKVFNTLATSRLAVYMYLNMNRVPLHLTHKQQEMVTWYPVIYACTHISIYTVCRTGYHFLCCRFTWTWTRDASLTIDYKAFSWTVWIMRRTPTSTSWLHNNVISCLLWSVSGRCLFK